MITPRPSLSARRAAGSQVSFFNTSKSLGDNYVSENKIEKGQRMKNKKRKHSDSFSQESSDNSGVRNSWY